MNESRPLIDLLTLLKSEIEANNLITGMCRMLKDNETMTWREVNRVEMYFYAEAPEHVKKYRTTRLGDYWWAPGKKEPRIKWLTEQINKLQEM